MDFYALANGLFKGRPTNRSAAMNDCLQPRAGESATARCRLQPSALLRACFAFGAQMQHFAALLDQCVGPV